MTALEEAVGRLGRHMQEKATRPTSGRHANAPGLSLRSQIPLPLNSDQTSNLVSRALFKRSSQAQQPYDDSRAIRLPKVGRVTYRGQPLLRSDWMVWNRLMTLARQQTPANRIEFSVQTFLKALGWGTTPYHQKRLRESLERMQATVLRLPGDVPNTLIARSLISKSEWLPSATGRSGQVRVWIEPEVLGLFVQKTAAHLD